MAKIIDSTVQAIIDGKNYTGVVLAQLHFDGEIIKLNNTPQSIYWDDEGSGEVEYLGVGNLASISTLPETNELGAIGVQLTLSGIPAANITRAFSDDYRNNPVFLWYGILDEDTYAVQGGTTGPVLAFAGLMDYCNIEFGEFCTVTLNAISRLSDWERPRGGRFNAGYQNQYIDPSDNGFDYVIPLQSITVTWGGRSLLDGGLGGGGGGGDPGRPYPIVVQQ